MFQKKRLVTTPLELLSSSWICFCEQWSPSLQIPLCLVQVLHVSGAEPTERALGNACKEKHVWPNCGHVVMWDAPEKFARVVREFQTNHAKATF